MDETFLQWLSDATKRDVLLFAFACLYPPIFFAIFFGNSGTVKVKIEKSDADHK